MIWILVFCSIRWILYYDVCEWFVSWWLNVRCVHLDEWVQRCHSVSTGVTSCLCSLLAVDCCGLRCVTLRCVWAARRWRSGWSAMGDSWPAMGTHGQLWGTPLWSPGMGWGTQAASTETTVYDGILVSDSGNSSALTVELPQSCAKPWTGTFLFHELSHIY